MGPDETTADTTEDTPPATPESAADTVSARAKRRRRASRAAGPATDTVGAAQLGMALERPVVTAPRATARPAPPPRRQPNRSMVAVAALSVLTVLALVLGWSVWTYASDERAADAIADRNRAFVDTASQTVVNMFSYTQDTIDESVERFYGGISGPLRDMMAQGNNIDNLKAIFRETQASSEAVISGAALEKVDEIAKNASVLVAVRVTVTDLDGLNAPSKPYRLRVIVHEDDDGRMTGYDLKYPDGGN